MLVPNLMVRQYWDLLNLRLAQKSAELGPVQRVLVSALTQRRSGLTEPTGNRLIRGWLDSTDEIFIGLYQWVHGKTRSDLFKKFTVPKEL